MPVCLFVRISIQFKLSSRGEKRDTGKRPNVFARNASWPDNPRSAARRAAQDLVFEVYGLGMELLLTFISSAGPLKTCSLLSMFETSFAFEKKSKAGS